MYVKILLLQEAKLPVIHLSLRLFYSHKPFSQSGPRRVCEETELKASPMDSGKRCSHFYSRFHFALSVICRTLLCVVLQRPSLASDLSGAKVKGFALGQGTQQGRQHSPGSSASGGTALQAGDTSAPEGENTTGLAAASHQLHQLLYITSTEPLTGKTSSGGTEDRHEFGSFSE